MYKKGMLLFAILTVFSVSGCSNKKTEKKEEEVINSGMRYDQNDSGASEGKVIRGDSEGAENPSDNGIIVEENIEKK